MLAQAGNTMQKKLAAYKRGNTMQKKLAAYKRGNTIQKKLAICRQNSIMQKSLPYAEGSYYTQKLIYKSNALQKFMAHKKPKSVSQAMLVMRSFCNNPVSIHATHPKKSYLRIALTLPFILTKMHKPPFRRISCMRKTKRRSQ